MKPVKLEVIMAAADKFTRPIKNALNESNRFADGLAGLRRDLSKMQKAQSDLKSFKSMQSEFKKTNNQVVNSRATLASLTSQKKKAGGASVELVQKIERERSTIQRLEIIREKQRSNLSQVSRSLKSVGVNTKNLSDAQKVITEKTKQATQKIDAKRSSVERVQVSVKKYRDRLQSLSQAEKKIGEYTQLNNRLNETKIKTQSARETVERLSRAYEAAHKPSQKLTDQFERSKASVVSLEKKHEKLNSQYLENNKSMVESRSDLKRLSAEMKKSEKPAESLRKEYVAAEKKVEKLSKSQKTLSVRLSESSVKVSTAKTKVSELGRAYESAHQPSAKLAKQFERSKVVVSELTAKQRQQTDGLRKLKTEIKAFGFGSSNLVKVQKDISKATDAANRKLEDQAKKLDVINRKAKRQAQEFGKMQRLREARDKTMARASNATVAGYGAYNVGSRAGRAAAQPATKSMDFNASMSKVQALTRLEVEKETDKKRFEMLRNQALDLGGKTSFNPTEVSQGQSFLAMSGFKPEEIAVSMEGMLNLAKAGSDSSGNADLAGTADISSNILSGFRLEADQMNRVGDTLVATFTRSNVDLRQLGESMKYAAPVAAELNVSLEETAAMSGLLGNVGIQGSMAGTALRALFNRMAAPPKMAAKALSDINVKTTDAVGNMRAVPEILAEVAQKTESMGNAERMGIFKAIAGSEAGASMAELVNQEGAAGIAKFAEILKGASGEAARVSKVMSANTKGDVVEAASAFDTLSINIGSRLEPTISSLLAKVTELTRSVNEWVVANPEIAEGVLKVALGVAGLVAGLGGLGVAIAATMGPFAIMRYGLGMIGVRLPSVIGTIRKFGGVMLWLGRVLMLNPLGLIITAVAAAAYGAYQLYKNWDTVVKWWDGVSFKSVAFNVLLGPLKIAWELAKKVYNWWNGETPKDKELSVNADGVNTGWGIGRGFMSWWNGETVNEKSASVNAGAIDTAWALAKRFSNWWEKLSLKSLIPDIKWPSVPSWVPGFGNSQTKKPAPIETVEKVNQKNTDSVIQESQAESESGGIGSRIMKFGRGLFGGARRRGGPVSEGSFYKVNEAGPELLSVGGDTFLMMSGGGSDGYVKPLGGGSMPAASSVAANDGVDGIPAAGSNAGATGGQNLTNVVSMVSRQSAPAQSVTVENKNNITIQIPAGATAGMDEEKLAELIAEKLREVEEEMAHDARASYFDAG